MTHIIIKSFNRPYYLDRCLQSIYKFVKGNFKIIVLDDGKIVGMGTHEELLKDCETYLEIAKSQLSEAELKGGAC